MSLKIKTKLRYGIGLLFAMIVLLGGLSVKNISDMSADTRNILADNYNSLLYSRRMLDALERIDSDPSAQADFVYFYALSYDDSMISIVSMVRRGSVVVSFTFGALLFREKNLKSKAIDLILVLIGMIFLYLGSKS